MRVSRSTALETDAANGVVVPTFVESAANVPWSAANAANAATGQAVLSLSYL